MTPLSLIVLFGAFLSLVPVAGHPATGIVDSKHDLSVSGPGPVKAETETRICVFCHTPHNATPRTPLWNREIGPKVYTFYWSETLQSPVPAQPTGATKLCLSCHDGTTAIGAVVNPAGGIAVAGSLATPPSGFSNLGTILLGHHPVSFSYSSALPNAELAATPPPRLIFGGIDDLQCTTCHDPHDDTNGKFLAMDNRYSALCITCHKKIGWEGSAHATSTALVAGVLPIPSKTWPNWLTVAEWGCEVCHTPHFAAGPKWLLNYTSSSSFCLSGSCHDGTSTPPPPIHTPSAPAVMAPQISSAAQTSPAPKAAKPGSIRAQIRKTSSHGGKSGLDDLLHYPKESTRSAVRHVTCVDCHNLHVTNRQKASAPYAPGALQGVKGVDRNGMETPRAVYEYEVCFRCHGDHNPNVPYVLRVVNTTNARLAFDPYNPSYHPVIGMGKNLNIPSIPSSYEPSLTASSMIYCTDCHRDDSGGSKGPHGSSFAPILRERYEMTDGTPESYESFALCYRCHERTSILSDVSFRKKTVKTTATGGGHSGHLARGATCSACHDPHGIIPDSRPSGSHSHLINFDTRIVAPVSRTPNNFPKFNDTGVFSGNCTLVCHGVVHNNQSYP